MTIDATCDVVPSTNELKLNGQTTIDMSALGMGELAVVITGDADGKELDLDIAVATMKVVENLSSRYEGLHLTLVGGGGNQHERVLKYCKLHPELFFNSKSPIFAPRKQKRTELYRSCLPNK